MCPSSFSALQHQNFGKRSINTCPALENHEETVEATRIYATLCILPRGKKQQHESRGRLCPMLPNASQCSPMLQNLLSPPPSTPIPLPPRAPDLNPLSLRVPHRNIHLHPFTTTVVLAFALLCISSLFCRAMPLQWTWIIH